jgi:hypothetical protein
MNPHTGMIALFLLAYCVFVWAVVMVVIEDRRDGR